MHLCRQCMTLIWKIVITLKAIGRNPKMLLIYSGHKLLQSDSKWISVGCSQQKVPFLKRQTSSHEINYRSKYVRLKIESNDNNSKKSIGFLCNSTGLNAHFSQSYWWSRRVIIHNGWRTGIWSTINITFNIEYICVCAKSDANIYLEQIFIFIDIYCLTVFQQKHQ